jgi:hypothetical protein
MAMGGLFSTIAGWITGSGNEPGTPETRKLGYDPTQVADAAAIDLTTPAAPDVQKELVVMALAGLGLILLLKPKRSSGAANGVP